jgi:hypothetical protein
MATIYDSMTGQSQNTSGMIDPRFQTAGGGPAKSPGMIWDYQQPQNMGGGDMNAAGAAQDPFAYTNGSLLTPWTRTFQAPTAAPSSSGGGQAGGPAPPPAPGFNFEFGGYAPRDVGDFNIASQFTAPAAPFSGGRVATPQAFSGGRMAEAPGFNAPVGAFNPAAYAGAGEFAGGPQFAQDRVGAFDAFVAPDTTQDKGYQFRLQQTQNAFLNAQAAKGLLRNGGTVQALMGLSGDMASQEYQAAYGRAKGEYDTAANLKLAAYDRNAAANRDENTINFDQRATAYGLNSQNLRDVYDRNYTAGLNANEQTYNRGASEYDRSIQNQRAANEINYGRAFNEDQSNFQRQFAVDEANYGRGASEYDRNFANARDVYQMNTGNALAAYQANAQNAQAMGNLGWNVASGTYDRNFQNYSTAFQIDEQRRQQAAAMAASGASAGAASEREAYNRALTQYNMEYEQYRNSQNDQFNRLYSLAALGQGAAGQVGAYGGQYAANAGNYMTGAGNALAAGQVGAANAWQAGMGNVGSAALQAAGMYMGSQQPAQQPPPYYFG